MKWQNVLLLCIVGSAITVLCPYAAADLEKRPRRFCSVKTRTLGIVLYDRFDLLDATGPAEIFGSIGRQINVVTVAEKAGPLTSTQGPKMHADYSLDNCPHLDLILVTGGIGTLRELTNERLHDWLRARAPTAEIVMSVGSGSSILAKAGLLDGRKATSNKKAFRLLTMRSKSVKWIKEARWVDEGNRVTSSGVAAGMDMALAVVERLYSRELARNIADAIEYQWHSDPSWDPFVHNVK